MAYQIVNGSCNCKPSLDGSCCGFRDRFFWNVEVRKCVDHSANGLPETVGDVVCDWNSEAGSMCCSVMSMLID